MAKPKQGAGPLYTHITVDRAELENGTFFKYLGSIMFSSLTVDEEINIRIAPDSKQLAA